jgi:DHA1 family inner membrane transport protein
MPNETGYVAAALFIGGFMMWVVSYLQMHNNQTPLEPCNA